MLEKAKQKMGPGCNSEEAMIIKSFKYFDLDNSGGLEIKEFSQAVEKLGVIIPT